MLYTNANISTIYQALVSHYHWRAQDFFKMAGGGGRGAGGSNYGLMETLGNKIVCAKIEANGKKTTKTLVNIYRNIDGMTTIAGTLTNSSLMTSYPVLMVMARVPPCARQSLQLYSVHRTVLYSIPV